MKKALVCMTLLTVVSLSFFGCSRQEKVIRSLGSCTQKAFYSCGVVRDYTDYAKYSFDNAKLEGNKYFLPLTEESEKTLNLYIDDFEGLVESLKDTDPQDELAAGYDFNRDIISDDDYVYIYTKPGYHEYENYDVYLFDTETQTLFYFHNNT